MPYTKQTFIDHETKLKAAHLQHIEDGIEEAFNEIDTLTTSLSDRPTTKEVEAMVTQAIGNIPVYTGEVEDV